MHVILTTVGNLVDLPKMTTLKRPPSDIHVATVNHPPDSHGTLHSCCTDGMNRCCLVL